MNYEFLRRVKLDESFDPNTWMSILGEYIQEYNPSIIGVSNIFDMSRLNFLHEYSKKIYLYIYIWQFFSLM